MKKISVSVEGRVQGVGFRFTTKQIADEIGIKGIVRNEDDGSVYIEAVGEDEKINQFIEKLKSNPTPFSKVEQVKVREEETLQNFLNFRITD